MKFFRASIFISIFLLVLISVYSSHINWFKVDVVFYASLFDVLLSTVLVLLLLIFIPYFYCFNRFEKVSLLIICTLFGYALAISVPTVIDRSLSFYILEKLQQRGGGILQTSMPEVFVSEYMSEAKLVEVRLTEQLESGTILIRDGCVKLTRKGEAIASFGQYFRRNWLPERRLLMGSYSDALVDPFRHSTRNVEGYVCK